MGDAFFERVLGLMDFRGVSKCSGWVGSRGGARLGNFWIEVRTGNDKGFEF